MIPVIIGKHLPLEKLFIANFNTNLHSSQEHTLLLLLLLLLLLSLLLLRNKLEFPSCRGLIKRVIKSCMYYRRRTVPPNPQTTSEISGDRLPINSKRVTNCGVNYFELYLVKISHKATANESIHKTSLLVFCKFKKNSS